MSAKAIYTYILMPFLIKPAFFNKSQAKEHGFLFNFTMKIFPFYKKKSVLLLHWKSVLQDFME